MKMEVETGGMQLQVEECEGVSVNCQKTGKGKESSFPIAFKGNMALPTSKFTLLASWTVRINFCGLNHTVCDTLLWHHWETYVVGQNSRK